eukprot:3844543-Rhodomonas_salina.1
MSPPRLTCEPQDTRPGARAQGSGQTARDTGSLAFLQGRRDDDWCREEPTRGLGGTLQPLLPSIVMRRRGAGRASLASSYPHPFPVVLGWK